MIVLGGVLAAISASALVLAIRGPSRVERLLAERLRGAGVSTVLRRKILPAHAALDRPGDEQVLARLIAAGAGALVGCVLALVLGLGLVPIAVCAYAGFVVPTVRAERRTAGRRRSAEQDAVVLVERLYALAASGRPVEAALIALAERARGSGLVDRVLRATRRDYLLGAAMHEAMGAHARGAGVPALVRLAERVERARTLGRGAVTVLADLREETREAERRVRLAEASQVEGKLTLVLTLCYLPALALLVVIPLFLTLLAGLSG